MKSARALLSAVLMLGVTLTGFLSVDVPRAHALTTVRATSVGHSNANFTPSVSAPVGTTVGDLMILVVVVNGGTTITDNNGSTPFTADLDSYSDSLGATGITVSIYSRRIQSGDPTTYNFSVGSDSDATRWSIIALDLANPDPSTIYDVAPSAANAVSDSSGTVTTADDPSITTTSDNALNIAFMAADSSSLVFTGFPAGYTSLQSSDETGAVAYKTISPAGATGAQTFTWNNTNSYIGFQFAVKSSTTTAAPARTMRLFEGFKIKLLSGRLKLLPMQ